MVEYAICFLLGLVFGSFANVLIYRVPRNISIFSPSRSFCPNCRRFIPFYLNIPVLSWIFLRGRCRWCGWKIPSRYPLVELLSGIFFVLAFHKVGEFDLRFAMHCVFLWGILVMTFTDIESMVIPSFIAIFGAMFFFIVKVLIFGRNVFSTAFETLFSALILYTVAVIYKFVRRREGLGLGDVEFMIFVGAFGGVWAGIISLVVGAFSGALWSFFLILRGKGLSHAIPFVPFLSLGALAWYVFEPDTRFLDLLFFY